MVIVPVSEVNVFLNRIEKEKALKINDFKALSYIHLLKVVPPGIEPGTQGFSVLCHQLSYAQHCVNCVCKDKRILGFTKFVLKMFAFILINPLPESYSSAMDSSAARRAFLAHRSDNGNKLVW